VTGQDGFEDTGGPPPRDRSLHALGVPSLTNEPNLMVGPSPGTRSAPPNAKCSALNACPSWNNGRSRSGASGHCGGSKPPEQSLDLTEFDLQSPTQAAHELPIVSTNSGADGKADAEVAT
jgi:hypothetical protein